MIIFRGLGILAPIIFAVVYFALYWFCKIFSSPELDAGWFVYFGASIAGIATWVIGSALNSEIYEIQRKHPEQEAYSHSLFFIPMEFWAIPFVIVMMYMGHQTTVKKDKIQAITERRELENKQKFENDLIDMEERIKNPKIGDYYGLAYKATYGNRNKKTTRVTPFKVTDFNDLQIQLFSPFDKPTEIKKQSFYEKKKILDVFEKSQQQGSYYWVSKTGLIKGINREYLSRKADLAYIPDFIDISFSISFLHRIDGPEFKYHTGFWRSSSDHKPSVNIALKNTGLLADIYAIQYMGNKISWGKDRRQGARINHNIKREQSPVNTNEMFYINCDITDTNAERHIEVFCHDNEGRKFRFDIRPNGKNLDIKRTEIKGLNK